MTAQNDRLTVKVKLAERSYEIVILSDQLASFGDYLTELCGGLPNRGPSAGSALMITDRNVEALYADVVQEGLVEAGWRCERLVLEPGERSKSLSVISEVYDRLIAMKADRQTVVVALGGGVVGDAAGFVAATYARGVPFVQVPTSLLAQVDSSVGGKVAVNHPQAKNMIGAFYQPLGVFIDTSVLKTLSGRDYRAGLGEVVKYGVILDADFFEYLEAHVGALNAQAPDALRHAIARSCQLKADVVEEDEFERTGVRAALNYGHTFAHAFETLCGYGELLHGEAVAIGMLYASRLAERRQLIDSSITARQKKLFEALGLQTQLPQADALTADNIVDRMMLDKKTVGGKLRFVLPTELGRVAVFKDVPESDVRAVLDAGGQ